MPGVPLGQGVDVRLSTFLVVHQILLDSGHDSLWDSPAAILESFGVFFSCKVPFHSKAWKWFGNFGQRDGRISQEAFPPHLQTAGCLPAPPVRASVLRRRREGSFWLGRAGVLICSRLFGPSGSGSTWTLCGCVLCSCGSKPYVLVSQGRNFPWRNCKGRGASPGKSASCLPYW